MKKNAPRRLRAALGLALVCLMPALGAEQRPPANLALVARSSTSYVSGHETIAALNDGFDPANSNDKSRGAYGNWPRKGTQWVQYEWSQPISTTAMDAYWFDDHAGVRRPQACRLLWWNGTAFTVITNASGLGLAEHCFNKTTFPEITTTRLRLEFDGNGDSSTGLLEWRVYDSGNSPNFRPVVSAGVDRVVVLPGRTYLSGTARDDGKPGSSPILRWAKGSGPGTVTFAEPGNGETTAQFSKIGEYVLRLTASDGQLDATSTLQATVVAAQPRPHLQLVATPHYRLTSSFWRARARALIVNWIPHCVRKIEDPTTNEGGIGNFVEAGRKLAGAADARHTGAVFANTWVYNTVEAMCAALLLDPQGDSDVRSAQVKMRQTLDDWIPKLLSAQEPDGYLHTQYTIQGHRRWSNKHDHEDYQAGYFIEAAIAHYQAAGGTDTRLLDAARRLADCWVRNIGPAPKRTWYPGHQELEQALVRLARLEAQLGRPAKAQAYVDLAKFLLDARGGGEEYDQSHLPVTRQYEAVGHAVRAVYSYSGMADVALETGDPDYLSAVQSIWKNIVERKYYITGGIGSGETSEGFGKDYSLPNHAYCESCANCGELFFQHKLHLLHRHARYADLFEETLYNAILGDVDLSGDNYTYTNPLDSSEPRYQWHVCPCCVGNIPRTLLMLPTWTYAQADDALYVNLFVGSSLTLPRLAGTAVQLVQTTDYPWDNRASLTLNPVGPATFSVHVRIPDRQASPLYTCSPAVRGLRSLTLNGKPIKPVIKDGYAVVRRKWQSGDTLRWEVPLAVQRVKASPKVSANLGRVALRYGPLVYNFESVDQELDSFLSPATPLATQWRPDLLGGVVAISGQFANGKPLLAVPNYARLNRGGRSIVWINDQ